MYDWSLSALDKYAFFEMFQLLLKGCTIEAVVMAYSCRMRTSFSCCWKDVRLKPYKCTAISPKPVSFSCCWKDVRLKPYSVCLAHASTVSFQLLLKGCTIEARRSSSSRTKSRSFSCCWKDVRLKRVNSERIVPIIRSFSCCWKDVRLKLAHANNATDLYVVSVVVERMYDWSLIDDIEKSIGIKVSVVVERMYDWSHESNFRFVKNDCVSVVVERMYDWSIVSGN